MTYSLRVGNELYVPIVTDPTRTMDIQLPSGQWIYYWDESLVVSGTLTGFPVPLGGEPIFIRQGALVPMDVESSQTGHGTVRVEGIADDARLPERHLDLPLPRDARRRRGSRSPRRSSATQLTLTADSRPAQQPVLYRIGRWAAAPDSVAVDGRGR